MSPTLIIRDWSDGYIALKARAEELRGSMELSPGTTERERWPRTTGADAIAIAAFVAPNLYAVRGFETTGLARRWAACLADLELHALPRLGETYPENRAFWRCLGSAVIYLWSVEAPLAPQAQWSALLRELGELAAYRNIGPTGAVPFGPFAGVKTFDDLYIAQYKHLRDERGAIHMEPEAGMGGGTFPVPRATNADVIALADYWSKQLGRVKKVMGHDSVVKRWNDSLADVSRLARAADPAAVYPKNNAFWRVLKTTAIQIAVADEAPTKWDRALDSLKTSVRHLPENLAAGAEVVASKVAGGAGDIAHGAGSIVNRVARGAFSRMGTPLLVAGGVVGALYLMRRRGRAKTKRSAE